MPTLSFQMRLALTTALAIVLIVIVVTLIGDVMIPRNVDSQIDSRLNAQLPWIRSLRGSVAAPGGFILPPRRHFQGVFVQFVTSNGHVFLPRNVRDQLPVTPLARAVARGTIYRQFTEMTVQGVNMRVLTVHVGAGLAAQAAMPIDQTDAVLRQVRFYFLVVAIAGTIVAGAVGALVARTALVPVRRLTRAVEDVTATGDLSQRVGEGSKDELGRLAAGFNTMLAALQESITAQRQLVADASHEMRTPLTSLRTNLEVLTRADALDVESRDRLIAALIRQIEDVTGLVGDIVELARDGEPHVDIEDVRLDLLVDRAIARTARHYPTVRFEPFLQETLVSGAQQRIDRAVTNLLGNAAKWSPAGGTVEVTVEDGSVTVRDHGPGIAPGDLPHIFDRFYRSPQARSMPGSGLGLAIVRQVAETHGGTVVAENSPEGGTVIKLSFPHNGRQT